MPPRDTSKRAPRQIVRDVLSEPTAKQLWSASYLPAIPFQIGDFRMGAVLTAVFYLFRWGHRRGKGKFADKFSTKGDRPTAASVSDKLVADNNSFRGWQSEPARAILGDLLLAHVFDTKGRAG